LEKDDEMKKQKISSPLDSLSEHIEPHHTWEDLILTKEKSAILHQIVDQARMNQGVLALFTGRGTTNKRIAVQCIANDLDLDLYHIDLSADVSKYIGETEKNLGLLFDAAENGGAILFFDEADALFGKRSEVKDSHDRYINLEIKYLLQRMEAYRGITILATNMKSALDPAFLRRLRFIVNFPFPGASERKLIWQTVFDNGKGPTKREAEGGDSTR
jgi:SpoVK/Ycf46/Vps4 family AAA+-type ATPase